MSQSQFTPKSPKYGQVTCTNAGTAYDLGTLPEAVTATITVKALAGNAGKVYLGDSSVTSSNGYELTAGQSVSLNIQDASALYVVAATSGDKVSFIAF